MPEDPDPDLRVYMMPARELLLMLTSSVVFQEKGTPSWLLLSTSIVSLPSSTTRLWFFQNQNVLSELVLMRG